MRPGAGRDSALVPPRPPSGATFTIVATVVLALLIALAFGVQGERSAAIRARDVIEQSYRRQLVMTGVLTDLQTAESAQRGYVVTRQPVFLGHYRPARRAIAARLADLEGLYGEGSAQRTLLHGFGETVSAKFAEMDDVLRLSQQNRTQAAAALVSDGRGWQLMEQARMLAARFVANERRGIGDEADAARVSRRLVDLDVGALLVFVIVCAALVLVATWFVRRRHYRLEYRVWVALTRLQAVFDGANDAIVLIGPGGAIESANATTARVLGYRPGALESRDIATLVDIAEGDGPFARRLGIVDGRLASPLRVDQVARHADGHAVPVDVALGLMPLDDGVHVVAALRDISERKATERLKDEFVATVSHELRTPLTSVLGALGLLRGGTAGSLPDPARRLVEIAENNSRRLIRLINDILDFDRIGSGRTTLDRMATDLAVVARRAIDDAGGLADERGVILTIASSERAIVLGDTERLLQVVGNLLSNAIRFSPAGGTVAVAVAKRGPRAVLWVEDAGPGVPQEFRNRIFDRFAQAESGAAIPGGTGLGLAISREIVRAHDGEIWLEDAAGGGARFCIALAVHEPVVAATSQARRVLVCEDDAEAAQVLRDMIEAEGYQVDRCGSAREAQAMARSGRYDGVVLDLHLPDANGLTAVRALRAWPETRDIPVIVVSAFARDKEQDPTAHALDVIDWIDKPVGRDRLVQAIGRAIAHSHGDRPTLLHVDDDPDMLEVTALGLADRGRMLRATNIAAARAILAEVTPDIVILDVNLAEGSGLELLPELFAADGTAVPVIIYSASELVPDIARPFDAVVVKSRRSLVALSDTIGEVLRRRDRTVDAIPATQEDQA